VKRKEFIQHSCLACLGALTTSSVLSGCSVSKTITGSIEGDDLAVPANAFMDKNGEALPYVVVSNAQLKQPVAVFRNDEGGYRGLLMRCTHRGVELNISGERLECTAHGSVFDNKGHVLEGPASSPLRSLPVREVDGRLFISLKA
jgi:nitrite reductase/ring-hydroxylating ferredoxin subunit